MSDSPTPYRWSLKARQKSKRVLGESKTLTLDDNLFMAQLQIQLPVPDLFAAASYRGTCIHAVNGEELVTDCSGIVYWPTHQMVLVADLHLEKGASLARRGQLLPPYDTMTTLRRLKHSLDKWHPKSVIALGDSFHDVEASRRLPVQARDSLNEMMRGRQWVWITGNHDPEPPENLGGEVFDELRIDRLILRHEPQRDGDAGELAGHLHPKARLMRRGRSVRRSCFAASTTRMILPSFGAYTGGLNVFDPAFDGLFDARNFHALMRGDEQVYRIAAADLS